MAGQAVPPGLRAVGRQRGGNRAGRVAALPAERGRAGLRQKLGRGRPGYRRGAYQAGSIDGDWCVGCRTSGWPSCCAARRADRSAWSRVCRWQAGMVAGLYIWLWAVVCFLSMFAIQCLLLAKGNRMPAVVIFPVFLVAIPAVAPPVGWSHRIRTLSLGLVLPVDRPAYLRQFGLAIALSHFQLWGAMALLSGLLFLLFPAAGAPHSTVSFPEMVAISGLYQIWSFGVCVAFARHAVLGLATVGTMAYLALFLPVILGFVRLFRQLRDPRPELVPITMDWPRHALGRWRLFNSRSAARLARLSPLARGGYRLRKSVSFGGAGDDPAGVLPRNRANRFVIQIGNAPLDILGPGGLHVGIERLIEALDQRCSQLGAFLFR